MTTEAKAAKARTPSATRRRKTAENPRALRPADIERLYGIPQSTLHFYCVELPESERLPSLKLPGRKSPTSTHPSKGARLVLVDDLEAWLMRWRTTAACPNEKARRVSTAGKNRRNLVTL